MLPEVSAGYLDKATGAVGINTNIGNFAGDLMEKSVGLAGNVAALGTTFALDQIKGVADLVQGKGLSAIKNTETSKQISQNIF